MSEAPFSRAVDPYDQVPYRDYAFGFTHPRHLEAVATLFGMVPPDATQCRVLELGSASGGNLIPQALELPESFFVGMDLSERQVNAGRAIIEQLRLKNIELRRANILQVDDGWGRFDYIIAHGVFSWVPREVREKVLEICSRNLAPNGVAIVSYNTYPGWHFKNLTRELMLYHSSQFEDPREQIGQALAILEFLVGLTPADSIPGRLFREQLEELRSQNDPTYVFHEYLEQTNEPIYFHHFIQRAEAHGLAYLAEAEFWRMLIENLPPQTHELFRRLPLIRQEQYLDFIRARAFRRTLLCHRDIPLQRNILPGLMTAYHFALELACHSSDVRWDDDSEAAFVVGNRRFTTSHRLAKAALACLKEASPGFLSFDQLHSATLARVAPASLQVGTDVHASRDALASLLLRAYASGLLEICLHPPAIAPPPASEKPTASPLARIQAGRGTALVTSLRHLCMSPDPLSVILLPYLDGTRGRQDLLPIVLEAFAADRFRVIQENVRLEQLDARMAAAFLEEALNKLACHGFLIA